jgi:hypothetical protein
MRKLTWATRLAVSCFAALAVFAASGSAHAQDAYYPPPNNGQPPPPPPNTPPPPPGAVAPNGQYVAPLSQPTQQIYIPQSVAMSGPSRITDWDDTQPVPPGYHVKTEARKGMIIGGAVLFGSLYLIDILVAAGGSDCQSRGDCSSNPYTAMWVPAVGPFLQMASNSSSVGNVFYAIDGLAQCAGIAMFIYGVAAPRTLLVRNDLGSIKKPLLVPMKMGVDGYGAGLVARF